MDLAKQVTEEQAMDWQSGLYKDIVQTLQTPVVNWIFRSLMANYPDFLRYAWGQVKPVYMNQGFSNIESDYHKALILPLIERFGLEPIIYSHSFELKKKISGQLTTFALVAPGLYVWFEILLRGLQNRPMGQDFDDSFDSTAPAEQTGIKGLPPQILRREEFSEKVASLCDAISKTHNLGGNLATIHLCLAQWPEFLQSAWERLEPILDTDTYRDAKAQSLKKIREFVDRIPYRPQLAPEVLSGLGLSSDDVNDLRSTFENSMSGGPATEVIPTISVYAYLAGIPITSPGGLRNYLAP